MWGLDTEEEGNLMIDEAIQREFMEHCIAMVQNDQINFGRVWRYQIEYKVKNEVVLHVKGDELKEYQGVFKFDKVTEEFFG